MKYVIKLCRQVGKNTFDIIYFNTYNNEPDFNFAVANLVVTFKQIGISDDKIERSFHEDGDFKIVYIGTRI